MPYPNDARQAGSYTAGAVNVNDYTIVPGVCALPLAEDAPTDENELITYSPVVILRLHAPYRIRRFTQATGKERNPAPIATPKDTGKFVFMGGSITVKPELSTTYNDYNWFVGCEYTFVENCTPNGPTGQPLGLVLGTVPVQTTIDESIQQSVGYSWPAYGPAALGGRAVTSGAILGTSIVNGQGALNTNWSYNAQAYYPPQLFYDDLPNGGYPVAQGG